MRRGVPRNSFALEVFAQQCVAFFAFCERGVTRGEPRVARVVCVQIACDQHTRKVQQLRVRQCSRVNRRGGVYVVPLVACFEARAVDVYRRLTEEVDSARRDERSYIPR